MTFATHIRSQEGTESGILYNNTCYEHVQQAMNGIVRHNNINNPFRKDWVIALTRRITTLNGISFRGLNISENYSFRMKKS